MKLFRLLGRILVGAAVGYAIYIPVMCVYERFAYGRVDSEKAFWAMCAPLLAPYLFLPRGWSALSYDEQFLVPSGAFLIVVFAALSIWRSRRIVSRTD